MQGSYILQLEKDAIPSIYPLTKFLRTAWRLLSGISKRSGKWLNI